MIKELEIPNRQIFPVRETAQAVAEMLKDVGVQVTINRPYPTTLPLLTVPSNLLVNLPMLPDDLEYRIVDRHLMLRDRDANLVIDMLYNVLPRS